MKLTMFEPATNVRRPILGIARETRFSPGEHAAGDAEILRLTQAALERAGYQTAIMAPECLPTEPPEARVVFAMCQSRDALAVLQEWENHGIVVVNAPAAVLSCYRQALVNTLSKATLLFPHSVVIPLDETAMAPHVCRWLPESPEGWWVKRGDVHAMQPDDVVFVPHAVACQEQLARLRRRGIGHAVVQEHIAGQEIKFYALRGHGLLHWFAPHGPDTLPIDLERLNALAMHIGELLALDVYGGDYVLTPDGALYVIDVNDWPSFRGCRPLAAEHIARYLLARAQQRRLL